MQVGGLAMHWGGVTPRFSPEDFKQRSLFGVGTDWPISYEELDPFYQEAEEIMGVAGEQGPPDLDPRGKPFPMPPIPLTYNLELLKTWTAKAGIAMWSQPSAKNSVPYRGRAQCCRNDTCSPICPIGAKYSPDFTWTALRRAGSVRLIPRTLVRRLVLGAGGETDLARRRRRPRSPQRSRGVSREAVRRRRGLHAGRRICCCSRRRTARRTASRTRRARSANTSPGIATCRRYVELPLRLYPGMNEQHSLVTKQFMRIKPGSRYMRHDLRVWESSVGQDAAAHRRRGRSHARRRDPRRLAQAHADRHGARARVLRRHSRSLERAHARLVAQERVGRSAAQAGVPRRARSRPNCAGRRRIRSKRCSSDMAKAGNGKVLRTDGRQLSGPSGGRLPHGDRPGVERRRLVGPDARSREPVRRRCADERERQLRERDADLLRARAPVGARDRAWFAEARLIGEIRSVLRALRCGRRARAGTGVQRMARVGRRSSAPRSIRRSPTSTAATSRKLRTRVGVGDR